MKVLIVYEKYLNNTLALGAPHYNLVNTFESAFGNDPNYELITRDISKDDIWSASKLSEVLLETEYDIAVISPAHHVHVEIETAKKVGKKLFICVWDTHCVATNNPYINFRIFLKATPDMGVYKYEYSCMEYSEYCNILALDYGIGEMFPNIYCVATPQDSRILYPVSDSEKEYEIVFNGSMYIPERDFFVSELKKRDYPIHHFGDRSKISLEQWAETHRKSKISLCFNASLFGTQRKGRIYEIASCGNFALVTHPEVYSCHKGKWFVEGEHFVKIDKDNYLDVIDYYMNNPEARIKIANQLHSFYMENYSEKKWWEDVIRFSTDK
jgi:hypothetical protein